MYYASLKLIWNTIQVNLIVVHMTNNFANELWLEKKAWKQKEKDVHKLS